MTKPSLIPSTIVQNGGKFIKIVQNEGKFIKNHSKWGKIIHNEGKFIKNRSKWGKSLKNRSKMRKISFEMGKNPSKIIQNGGKSLTSQFPTRTWQSFPSFIFNSDWFHFHFWLNCIDWFPANEFLAPTSLFWLHHVNKLRFEYFSSWIYPKKKWGKQINNNKNSHKLNGKIYWRLSFFVLLDSSRRWVNKQIRIG